MADFTFTSPEGKSYTVSGPEGSNQSDAFNILQSHMAGPTENPASAPQVQPTPKPTRQEIDEIAKTDPEGAANLEAQNAAPDARPQLPQLVKPEEVYIAPDAKLSDKEAAWKAMGIDVDLAKQSKNYDPDAINQQYKDKNPGLGQNVATSIGESSPVASDTVTHVFKGLVNFGGDIKDLLLNNSVRSPADIEHGKLQDAINRNINEQLINKGENLDANGNYSSPTGEKVGYGTGALAAGIATGGAADAVLPEVAGAGLLARGAQVGRSAIIGGASGAASEPTNPLQGAETGALTGGVLSTAAQGVGAGVRAVSKNAVAINDAANIVGAKPGIAEILGKPNLVGERAMSTTPFIGWLSGTAQSQATKMLAAGTALPRAAQAINTEYLAGKNWYQVLKDSPVPMGETTFGTIPDISAPNFKAIYNNLPQEQKYATIQGLLEGGWSDAASAGANSVGSGSSTSVISSMMKSSSTSLSQIVKTIGDQEFVRGPQKWTLDGLQKLLDISNNPKLAAKYTQGALNNLTGKTSKITSFITSTIPNLADDVLSVGAGGTAHGVASVAGGLPWKFQMMNWMLNSKSARNALTNLASANTNAQTISALSALATASDQSD